MMKQYLFFGVVLGLLVTGSFAGIEIQHDESAEFSSYKTYAWKEGIPANNPKMQAYLEARIDEQLAAKGLRKVDRELPDLYVSTHAYSLTDMQANSTYLYSPRYDVGVISTRTTDVTSATLMVDLVEVESDKVVWQGVAQEKIAGREPAKIKKKIDKIAKKMFKEFPPA